MKLFSASYNAIPAVLIQVQKLFNECYTRYQFLHMSLTNAAKNEHSPIPTIPRPTTKMVLRCMLAVIAT